MVSHKRLEERRRFGVNVRVCLLAADGLLRPTDGGLQEAAVYEETRTDLESR
jgi:hypothetical protein